MAPDRPTRIEITEEMIRAGARELSSHDLTQPCAISDVEGELATREG